MSVKCLFCWTIKNKYIKIDEKRNMNSVCEAKGGKL